MRIRAVFGFLFLLVFPILLHAEEQITITRHYSSPYGIYKTLRLLPNDDSTPNGACTSEGQMYYDRSDQTVYVCSGTPAKWTVSPGQKGGDAYWTVTPSDANSIYNKNSGSVGISTNDPGVKLDVNGKLIVSGYAFLDNEWNRQSGALDAPFAVYCGNPAVWPGSVGLNIFQPDGSSYLRIEATGQSVAFGYWAGVAESFNFVFLPPSGFSGVGNIGIGTTMPKEKVDINGNLAVHNGNYGYYSYWTRIRSEGNYFTGGTTASVIEQVSQDSSSAGPGIALGFTGSTGTHTPVLAIRGSGNVGIGTKEPAYQLELSSNSAAKPTSNTWTVASDMRLKKDIQPFTDGLSIDLQIHPVRYKLNGKAGLPKDAEGISVIGQEIEKIAPYTVKKFRAKLEPTDKEETELLSFDSSPLVFVMINAIKEQQGRIEKLKAQIARLKAGKGG